MHNGKNNNLLQKRSSLITRPHLPRQNFKLKAPNRKIKAEIIFTTKYFREASTLRLVSLKYRIGTTLNVPNSNLTQIKNNFLEVTTKKTLIKEKKRRKKTTKRLI